MSGRGFIVLGIDPGLANCGWAFLRLLGREERVLGLGVLQTAKGKGQGVLVTDDLHRRGQELARQLEEVMRLYPIGCVCAESISYPRNAASSAMIGRAWGVIDGLLERHHLPLIDALDERFDGAIRRHLKGIRAKTNHEHAADAVGAVVASLNHDHLRLARNVAAQMHIDEVS